MAQSKAQREKAAQRRVDAPATAGARIDQRSADSLRQECERLRVELQAAREEIAVLRSRQEQVLNRIDWALDTLESLSQVES